MKLSKKYYGVIIVTGMLVTASVLVPVSRAGGVLSGVVEQSFDKERGLIRTDRFIYQIKVGTMSERDKKQMERVGSSITVRLTAGAIDRAWPLVTSEKMPGAIGAKALKPVKADSIFGVDDKNLLILTGIIVAMPSQDEHFIQVLGTIYRIRGNMLSAKTNEQLERIGERVSVAVPASAINFAWKSEGGAGRVLASGASSVQRDSFFISENRLQVQGIVRQSFDDNKAVVQSGDTFFELDRSALWKSDALAAPRVGNHVSWKVPLNGVSALWVVEGAAR